MAQAAEENGLGLEYLDTLTLFSERFEYLQKSYQYKEVQHLEFTAQVTKHSVNSIPTGTTYSANLVLHFKGGTRLQIEQQRAPFGRKKKQRYEAIIRAASILMNITFNQRVESYERQLEEKNFITIGEHQFHKQGDLFRRNQFCLNILDPRVSCSLGPFNVSFKKMPSVSERIKNWFSNQSEVVDLSTDKDCFLYIMKRQFGLTWADQPVPERSKSAKQFFSEALLILGGKLCKADGNISSQEIALFKKYFGIDEITYPGAGKIFMDAATDADTGALAAKRIYEILTGQKRPLEYIVIGLMQIAASDGSLHRAEIDFIRRIAEVFRFFDNGSGPALSDL